MDKAFWLQSWQAGRTDFHQQRVLPLLQQHWPTLRLQEGARVLVPLAGKSLDMLWLAQRGHAVLGIELSPLAVAQFLDDNGLQPDVHVSALGVHHRVGNIDLVCGDVFDLDAAMLRDCGAVYDRAALVALPDGVRRRYVEHVYGLLPAGTEGLLVTLEYAQQQMPGPPFSVDEAQVRQLFTPRWQVRQLERRAIAPDGRRFQESGVDALHTAVYHLQRR